MIVLRSPLLQQLHAYWEGKRGARLAPVRDELDPAEIVRLLPHLFLIDAIGMPSRFRYRLIGTAVVELTGRDLTGHFVDENLEKAKFAAVVEPYEAVIRQARPGEVPGHRPINGATVRQPVRPVQQDDRRGRPDPLGRKPLDEHLPAAVQDDLGFVQ